MCEKDFGSSADMNFEENESKIDWQRIVSGSSVDRLTNIGNPGTLLK